MPFWVVASLWWKGRAKPWLKENWVWIILPIGIILYVLGYVSKKTRDVTVVPTELHEADKKKEVVRKELEVELEKLEADKQAQIAAVVKEHAAVIEKLTTEQADEAKKLLVSPAELNVYLLEVGRKVRS